MANAKNFEYVETKELGTIGENITVSLGHYTDGKKEFSDKIYIFNHYEKKDGTKCTSSLGKFSISEFTELQKIDVSDLDADFDKNEAFD